MQKAYSMKTVIAFVFSLVFLFLPGQVFAQASETCKTIAGGGTTCVTTNNFSINKTVLNPQTNKFSDNLTIADPKYTPLFNISFKLEVTNKTDGELKDIVVTDTLPRFVTFVTGSGKFDPATNTMTLTITSLKKQESKSYNIQGKIAGADQLPTNIVCVANQAVATRGNQIASDNTQFCIQREAMEQSQVQGDQTQTMQDTTKGGLSVITTQPTTTKGGKTIEQQPPATQLPPTGPELLPLISLLPIGTAGMWIRRKTSL